MVISQSTIVFGIHHHPKLTSERHLYRVRRSTSKGGNDDHPCGPSDRDVHLCGQDRNNEIKLLMYRLQESSWIIWAHLSCNPQSVRYLTVL